MQRTLNRAGILTTVAIAAMLGGHAMAQPCQIDAAITTSMTLTDAQRQTIAACAQEHAANLTSDDAEKRKAARNALLSPLEGAGVTVAFRTEMWRALEKSLRDIAANPDDRIAVGALIIAGDLATETSTGMLTRTLTSPRPALRFQAAYGLRRTFEAAAIALPAVQSATATSALDALRDAAVKEQDGQVLKAYVAAILAGGNLPSGSFPTAESDAVTALCIGVSGNIKARAAKLPDQSALEAYHKSVRGVRDIFAQPNARMTAVSANAAAELSGRTIALAVRTLKSNEFQPASEASRGELVNAVAASETLIQLAANTLSPGTKVAAPGLGASLREGTPNSNSTFILDADRQLIGADGALTKAPFGFAKTHFLP